MMIPYTPPRPDRRLPDLLTCEEAAKFLRVTPATVRNMIRDERLHAIQLTGGRGIYRVPLSALETLLGIDQTHAQSETRSTNS